ncbi:DUF4905 domain-containing protein [Pontibacter oryzae]|nr:DUF4905 domain-containing protein [Pontibacter oryzae]
MRLDSITGCLAIEIRDADVLLTSFYTLDTASHTLKQLQLPQAKAWWQGLEDATHGFLYLHGYGNRQLGQHKGIIAISQVTGKQVWETKELAFYGVDSPGLLAYNPEQPEAALQVLHPTTGKATGITRTQQEAAAEVAKYNQIRYQNCIYPTLYLEGEDHFNTVQFFLKQEFEIEVVKAIDYAETDSCLLVSFYTLEPDGKLQNELAVFNLKGDLQLKVTLGTALTGIGSDTFFIFKHNLYFIQNKDILQVFRLLV